jgi:hypothetical protein
VYFDRFLSISSLIPSKQGGIPLSSSTLPPSPRMVSFDWNDIVEPHLPSSPPFQIMVEINKLGIHQSIVNEGSSTGILSSSSWQALGSPKLVSATSELLDFNKIPSECLGILPHFPITLGGKIVLVNILVVLDPLDFNFILGCDYVYVINFVVSTLFHVMYFSHNGRIVTIDQLSFDNRHPVSALP